MKGHTHLSDQVLDIIVEEIPKLPARTALKLGGRLYEVIHRHLVARAAEDVPYATPAEQSAREEAVAFQHAAADAQLLARHRFNTASFEGPENPTTALLTPAARGDHLPKFVDVNAWIDRRLEKMRREELDHQGSLFTQGQPTPPTSEEKSEAEKGAAPRRGRRSRGRKPRVRDSKVRLSKAIAHFDRGPDGRRVVTLHQLALLAEKIELPLPYVLDLLTKWRRVMVLPDQQYEIRETEDVLLEWALELLPQGYAIDDVAHRSGVSASTARTWKRRRDADDASALKAVGR